MGFATIPTEFDALNALLRGVDLLALGQRYQRPRWMRDGLCREYPDLNWFCESRTDAVHAMPSRCRAVCARCLVRAECLEYATEHDEVGIWGGLDQRERRKLKRDAA